ncbi:DinB family protein [Marinigracilibium pacificum]|uniref:DinB family protein n=1 Tax=Marinigracilibium pacificum TaxID=2729599 RepID=A0A848J2C1_9BACT|nr:DinB family protein [Marinigracilibium pacificum]NMM48690.1 DinB family protein [Marinigracilibium pacificum]
MILSYSEINQDLIHRTELCLDFARSIRNYSSEKLNHRPGDTSWSALECIEHLNRYSEFYLPVFMKELSLPSKVSKNQFSPGWLGEKFADSVKPLSEGASKMPTFKSKNPIHEELDPTVIDEFTTDLNAFLNTIKKGFSGVNLDKKVSTTLPVIKLKLGDALRVYAFHNHRHIEQAKKAIESY